MHSIYHQKSHELQYMQDRFWWEFNLVPVQLRTIGGHNYWQLTTNDNAAHFSYYTHILADIITGSFREKSKFNTLPNLTHVQNKCAYRAVELTSRKISMRLAPIIPWSRLFKSFRILCALTISSSTCTISLSSTECLLLVSSPVTAVWVRELE